MAGTGTLGYNDAAHKHGVTHGTWGLIAEYDANGNMTHHWDYPNGLARWYRQDWDADNRLTAVRDDSYNLLVQFSYDADGNRVRKVANGQTTAYIGNYYEKNVTTGIETKYYYLGGQRIAMRQGTTTASTVTYLHSDHLGSASLTSDTGVKGAELRYKPFGEVRWVNGTMPTDRRFNGNLDDGVGLLDYPANNACTMRSAACPSP